jgi:hypothetical protein
MDTPIKEDIYIEVDEKHRIRSTPNGTYYAQFEGTVFDDQTNLFVQRWRYYCTKSGGTRKFTTEQAARTFLEKKRRRDSVNDL